MPEIFTSLVEFNLCFIIFTKIRRIGSIVLNTNEELLKSQSQRYKPILSIVLEIYFREVNSLLLHIECTVVELTF